MMDPKLFRYWIARLRPIATVQVWLPLVGATMVGGFMWVAYRNPESLSVLGGKENTGESAEESAIGADIDSVSVLMEEMNSKGDPGISEVTRPSSSALKPGSPNVAGKETSPNTIAKITTDNSGVLSLSQLVRFTSNGGNNGGNPFNESNGITAMNALNVSNPGPGTSAIPLQNSLFPTSSTSTPTTTRPNPLAQAIDRLTGQPSGQGFYQNMGMTAGANPGTTPVEGTGPIVSTPAWNGIPTNGTSGLTTPTPPIGSSSGYGNNPANSGNAYTYITGGSSGSGLPDTGVATPIAPVSVPTLPYPGNSSGNMNSGVVNPLPLPGAGIPDSASPLPSEQVFTAPRLIPGRPIGGGNINTFSNP